MIGVLAIDPHYSARERRFERRSYESVRPRAATGVVLVVVFAAALWLLSVLGLSLDVGAYTLLPGIAAGSVLAELVRRSVPRFTET